MTVPATYLTMPENGSKRWDHQRFGNWDTGKALLLSVLTAKRRLSKKGCRMCGNMLPWVRSFWSRIQIRQEKNPNLLQFPRRKRDNSGRSALRNGQKGRAASFRTPWKKESRMYLRNPKRHLLTRIYFLQLKSWRKPVLTLMLNYNNKRRRENQMLITANGM